jgi:hypothetical protein
MPTTPGVNQFRYFLNNSYTLESAGPVVTVGP